MCENLSSIAAEIQIKFGLKLNGTAKAGACCNIGTAKAGAC
jgi:hypothetical protein